MSNERVSQIWREWPLLSFCFNWICELILTNLNVSYRVKTVSDFYLDPESIRSSAKSKSGASRRNEVAIPNFKNRDFICVLVSSFA